MWYFFINLYCITGNDNFVFILHCCQSPDRNKAIKFQSFYVIKICLFTLQGILLFSLVKFKPVKYLDYSYPTWAHVVGGFMALSSVSIIPIYMIYKFITTPGTIEEVSTHHVIFTFLYVVLHERYTAVHIYYPLACNIQMYIYNYSQTCFCRHLY